MVPLLEIIHVSVMFSSEVELKVVKLQSQINIFDAALIFERKMVPVL